jgi:hypothetical protein
MLHGLRGRNLGARVLVSSFPIWHRARLERGLPSRSGPFFVLLRRTRMASNGRHGYSY